MHSDTTRLFQFDAKPGAYQVGFRVVEQYDHSRVFRQRTDPLGRQFSGECARPLQTLIWYPAVRRKKQEPLMVEDYANLWSTETSFSLPTLPLRAKEWIAAMAPALAMPLTAIRDAEPSPGRFPVVIYAPSFSSVSWENADLCEYLASNGFVVVASPSMGASTRTMTADLSGIDAQARDVSFLIAYASTLTNADVTKVAVAGFSWGGISNVFAAARDHRIRALIALDGSLRYWPGLFKQAPDVCAAQMTIPLMALSKGEWTLEEQARFLTAAQIDGPNVLNAWTHGDLVTVRMLGMTHRQFSSMAQRNEDFWQDFSDEEFPDKQIADYEREDGMVGYSWVARYTLNFLNAHLRRDLPAMAFLRNTPAQNGVPQHLMATSFRATTSIPASLAAFRAEVGKRGFDCAQDVYAAMRSSAPDFTLNEAAVNDWAEELLNSGHLRQAIHLLIFGVHLNPQSSGAYASLARARRIAGQAQAALENYKKALELNVSNAEARRKILELENPATQTDQHRAEIEPL